MATEARRFEYAVELDPTWKAASDRGGAPLAHDGRTWTPEHLLLAALCRCTLTSLDFHARRAGIGVVARGRAQGVVTRREEDERYAFVEVVADLDVKLDPLPDEQARRELLAKAERDCFVGASLTARPSYRWRVNGEVIA